MRKKIHNKIKLTYYVPKEDQDEYFRDRLVPVKHHQQTYNRNENDVHTGDLDLFEWVVEDVKIESGCDRFCKGKQKVLTRMRCLRQIVGQYVDDAYCPSKYGPRRSYEYRDCNMDCSLK